jgi:hypothetical protein
VRSSSEVRGGGAEVEEPEPEVCAFVRSSSEVEGRDAEEEEPGPEEGIVF